MLRSLVFLDSPDGRRTHTPGHPCPAPGRVYSRAEPSPLACLHRSPPRTRNTSGPSSPHTCAPRGRSGSCRCSAAPPRDLSTETHRDALSTQNTSFEGQIIELNICKKKKKKKKKGSSLFFLERGV